MASMETYGATDNSERISEDLTLTLSSQFDPVVRLNISVMLVLSLRLIQVDSLLATDWLVNV